MTSQVHEPETSGLGWEDEQERRAAPPGLLDSGMLFARSAQLTCEGALRLLFSTSARDIWDRLVRAGLEWEDEYTHESEHRGRQRAERA
jgi:hypothetical protein